MLSAGEVEGGGGGEGSAEVSKEQAKELLRLFLPSDEQEECMCSRMVAAGARDGISGKAELSVDGMPLTRSLDMLRTLRGICD